MKGKSVLTDFYNLHLECFKIDYVRKWPPDDFNKVFVIRNGEVHLIDSNEVQEGEDYIQKIQVYHYGPCSSPYFDVQISLPTEAEKQKLIDFFRRYAPNVTQMLDVETFLKNRHEKEVIEEISSLFQPPLGSLAWYEWQNEKKWWESKNFFDFTFDYCMIRIITNNCLKRRLIKGWHWHLLKEKVQKYSHAVILMDKQTQKPIRVELDDILLDNVSIENGGQYDGMIYGLLLGVLFYNLYLELIDFLRQEIILDKCKICPKLFKVNKKNQVYCSPECRQVPDTEKKEKQSDEIHQELCELIDEWMGPKQESEWIDADRLAGDLSKEFSIGSVYQKDLDNQNISEGLRWQFKNNGISLSDNPTIKSKGREWLITNEDKTYIVKKEKGELNIIRKTFLLDKSPAHSLGSYLKEPKFENKLKEEKKIIIQTREKRKNKEYKFIRI